MLPGPSWSSTRTSETVSQANLHKLTHSGISYGNIKLPDRKLDELQRRSTTT